jgi:hypothetical protein
MAIKKVVKMSAAPKKSDPGKGMKGVVKGVKNAGKVVQKVKSESKPIMENRIKMDSKPIMVQRVKMDSKPINNSYKMSASESAKKYTQAEINKFTKKKP